MNKEQITAVARKHGQSYTSRPFINGLSFAFGNEAWAAFCEALASPQPVQQSVQPVAVISGAFGGRPCIRVLDTAAIYPDGTALYTSPPIAQPVQPAAHTTKGFPKYAQDHPNYPYGADTKFRAGFDFGYMTALEAIAQPAPVQRYEPEIWREERIRMEPDTDGDWVKWSDVGVQRRPQRVPLTIEQIYELWPIKYSAFCEESTKFVRAIEAAHGIKEAK